MFGTLQVAFKHAGELLVFPPTSTTMMSRSAPSDESSERMVAQITFSSL